MPDEPNPAETRKPETSAELKMVLEALSAKHGDTETVAMKLIKQNVELGAKLATAEAKVKEVEGKLTQALPSDHVAVPKADAELLASYKVLGEPDKLKATLDKVPTLESTVARNAREKELAVVARIAGYEPDVLGRLATDGIRFVPTKVKVKGQAEEVDTFEVIDTDNEGKERKRPLAEVESSDWKTFLPALKPGQGSNSDSRPSRPVGNSPYRGSMNLPFVAPNGNPLTRELTPDERTAQAARRVASVL